jgi:hypothetical protein
VYIEINREKMTFLRRMADRATLSKLADIEHSDIHVLLTDEDTSYELLTDLELKKLIQNSNGPDVKLVFHRGTLIRILRSITAELPVFEANAFQVDMQWRCIERDDDRVYAFVPGAFKPVLAEEGVEAAALQYAGGTLNVPASPANPAPQGTAAGSTARPLFVGRDYSGAAAPQRQEAGDFASPKPGTSTHDIFTFCWQKWSETGFTTDERQLADIRKTAVDQLVPKGLNVSTVRTQAMRWYHNRTRFAG